MGFCGSSGLSTSGRHIYAGCVPLTLSLELASIASVSLAQEHRMT